MAEQLHDKVLFTANTGIRLEEANWLEYRDVEIVEDDATGETILEIEVRGKRGVDDEMCKWRHFIENYFQTLKEFKRIAIRSDKTDTSYAAMINLCAATINSRYMSTNPSPHHCLLGTSGGMVA